MSLYIAETEADFSFPCSDILVTELTHRRQEKPRRLSEVLRSRRLAVNNTSESEISAEKGRRRGIVMLKQSFSINVKCSKSNLSQNEDTKG